MFTDPNMFFNNTLVPIDPATVVNGTMTPGVYFTITEVYGVDLMVSLLIVIAFGVWFQVAWSIMGWFFRRKE